MESMLVTEGLNELKTLDSRIYRAISNAQLVTAAKTSNSNVTPNCTKEEFKKNAISSLDSIKALIDRREKIKAAIIESNAKTEVEICGKMYTIARVIDMKSSIKYKEELLYAMSTQLDLATKTMNKQNAEMESKIDQLVSAAFGKDSKVSVKDTEYTAIAAPYRANNEVSLVDPIEIKHRIEELKSFIEEFKATVDSKLQISNCVTYIEI